MDKGTCVLVGDRLRLQATVRSDLLSGIRNTSGVACLPGNISAEDLQLWQAACLVCYEPSTSECVTILKVRPVAVDVGTSVHSAPTGRPPIAA